MCSSKSISFRIPLSDDAEDTAVDYYDMDDVPTIIVSHMDDDEDDVVGITDVARHQQNAGFEDSVHILPVSLSEREPRIYINNYISQSN